MLFTKYHALGNDYIIVDPIDLGFELTVTHVKTLCDRHYGIGSDGVLYGPLVSEQCDFAVRIFNPDGSEAEKSGNGLRIFSRYLWDRGLVTNNKFSIETKGGNVYSTISPSGSQVSVEMGKVRFTHADVGEPNVASQEIIVNEKIFQFYAANVGNPHCVILVDELASNLAKFYGSVIEKDCRFLNQTNVQFVKVISRNSIAIEIWERGAGYTLASGSSSTAAAAVVFALGLCDSNISVKMPGGTINISLNDQFYVVMTGAVCKIGGGYLSEEALPVA